MASVERRKRYGIATKCGNRPRLGDSCRSRVDPMRGELEIERNGDFDIGTRGLE